MESVPPEHVSMLDMEQSVELITGRIRALRKRAGLSMEQFAKALGMKGASSVQRYENPNEYAGGYLKRDLVALMEKALVRKGTPPISKEEVWELAGPEFMATPLEPPNAVIGQLIPASHFTIPLYGQAVGGIDGEFVLNDGTKLADIPAPPALATITGAYAVSVSGESMEPRYYDGEVVFVNPRQRPVKGNFVVAQIHNPNDGPPLAFVKRLVRYNEGGLVLEQFNPVKELRFEHRQVISLHVVVMGGDKFVDRLF